MLTRDVRVEGFTAEDWSRLSESLRSPEPAEVSGDEASGGVVAVVTGNRLRKLVSTRDRRLDPAAQTWPVPLRELARAHRAAWAVSIHTGALEELMDRFGERLRPEQDLLEQAVLAASLVKELSEEGAVRSWPWSPAAWSVPSERVALRALDFVCPNGKALALGVFSHGEVYTAGVVRRMGKGFDHIVGPQVLRSEMGLVSGDWTRDYRHLARAMETRVGPLAIGCFGELDTFHRLAADPAPGAWAGAVAARDIYLAPATPAVAIPLSIDVGRAALVAMRGVAARLGAGDLVAEDGPLAPALDRLSNFQLGGRDLEALLGFDPIALLRKLVLQRGRD